MRTTVKPQPGPGIPSVAFGTVTVMKRETGFAVIPTVPSVAPPASTYRWPKPCTWIRRLQANGAAIVKLRDVFAAAVEVVTAPGTWT